MKRKYTRTRIPSILRGISQNPMVLENRIPNSFLVSDDGTFSCYISTNSCSDVLDANLRLCPGRFLAEASVWIAAVTLLSAFDICPIQDEDGKDIVPPAAFNTAITW